MKNRWMAIFVSIALLCAAAPLFAQTTQNKDPLEKPNRVIFKFNQKLDDYLFRPMAKFYDKAMPKPLNTALDDVFHNLDTVPIIANDILQFKLYQATSDTWRLAINSTVGVGGMWDPASRIGLPAHKQDFGLTLATWGWKNSTYIVLPFFGPETVRDSLAIPADYAMSIDPYMGDVEERNYLYALEQLDKRAQLLVFQKVYDEMALDPYTFMRNAYLQRRHYLITNQQETHTETAKKVEKSDPDDIYYLNE